MSQASQQIVFKQLSKQFAEVTALQPLSLTINSGGVTGLIGPDGAGKTTLLRMCAGLLTPSSGELKVADYDPVAQSRELREVLGYMPQKFGLYEDLTVQENLNLFADLRGIAHEQRQALFQQLLEFTDLGRFTDRFAGKLSGGMKQKLGLACTLLGQPKVLLLDEPGVGVDPISRRELWKMVHQLADDGMLIIWSTSYLDEAEQCENVILLNEGKMLYRGEPKQLTEQVSQRVILLSSPYSHRKLLQSALKQPQVSDGVIQGEDVRLILKPDSQVEQLLPQLPTKEIKVTPTQGRFEDAFIDLLGGVETKQSVLSEIMQQIEGDPQEIVIEARELTKQFGDFTATDHVSFQVQRGQIFGLLGPNGAGKSTTFKMMCGLLPITSGDALVLGYNLKKQSDAARQRIGYMAQRFSLYDKLTVLQNLQFFSGVYGLSGKLQQQRIDEMIQVFNFQKIIQVTPQSLPLGYKQRLAIACALMHRPEIIFLDEPTSGVDPITRREFWIHINGLVEKGVTVMVTTHFMDEAEYCDRIGLVSRGQLIALDTPDALKQQVASDKLPNPTMEDAFIQLVTQSQEQ